MIQAVLKNKMQKRLTCLLLILFVVLLHIAAQNTTVYGKVTDEKGLAVEKTTVSANVGKNALTTFSDKQGNYKIAFNAKDSTLVSYTHTGFDKKTIKAPAGKNLRIDIVLKAKETMLDEVTVKGKEVIVDDDHVSYMPNKRQTNTARSGVDLLFNLMIPQLRVNKFTGTVSSTDNAALAIYIDGRKANQEEISQMRSKDVQRVEVYNNAIHKFPNEQRVVNFVMKKYDYGGYVKIDTDTRFINEQGHYSAQASFDKKDMNYIVLAGTRMNRSKGDGLTAIQSYKMDEYFDKESETNGMSYKGLMHYGTFRTTYQHQGTFIRGEAGLMWNETPNYRYSSSVKYTPKIYNSTMASSDMYKSNLFPYLGIYFQSKLKGNQRLLGSVQLNYGHNKYDRLYKENEEKEAIVNNTKESMYHYDAKLSYSVAFNRKSSMNLLLWNTYRHSDADYKGTITTKQQLSSFDILFYPTYTHNFANKVRLSLQAGFDLNVYKITERKSVTKIWPRPAITLNYKINDRNNIGLWGVWGTSTPQMAFLNSAEQRVSQYELLRGNPDLKTMKIVQTMMAYNYNKSIFSMSAYATYNSVLDLSKTTYKVEGSDMVSTFITNGDYHKLVTGAGIRIKLFNKSLDLNANVNMIYTYITGLYSNRVVKPEFITSATYFIKDFSFTGYYNPFSKNLTNDLMFTEERADYGITAGWGKAGWIVEAGMKRMFENHAQQTSYYNFDVYSFRNINRMDAFGRQVFVKVSYSFDFGRKIQRQNIQMKQAEESGILHP